MQNMSIQSWLRAGKELGYDHDDIINIGWYCTDRICLMGKAEKIAMSYEGFGGESLNYTFNDLRITSNTMGHFLRKLGVQPEERVCLFMDRIPELYFSFLAILKIGAVVQPLFSAFGEDSLFIRLDDAETKVIITQKKHLSKVRKIVSRLPSLKHVIIVDNHKREDLKANEVLYDFKKEPPVEKLEIFPTKAESPSVLHYTSGTTGKPKGVIHVHNSLISQYFTSKIVLDLHDDDIYWCTADPGWVTGTSYGIIGPWSMGITQCILNAGFSAETWYRFIEKHRITVWYTAPTAVRSLMKAGEESLKNFDLSCLRHLASVGEPLNPEAVIWSQRFLGKPFHDTFWQTETGSIMIANMPGMKIKPGSMGKPFPGITGAILHPETLQPVEGFGKPGLIAFKPDWPAMMRGYWNNNEKYREKFVNGWYLSGDRASIDSDGYFWFIARDDDIINTGGHLVSPFEVESVLMEHPAVAESAVISKPDDINMEVVKAIITIRDGFTPGPELDLEIMNFVRKRLSAVAMPQEIEYINKIPRTRSGKIMRRLLRAKEWGEDIGDLSTLEND